jgi:SulP family sulfate permease
VPVLRVESGLFFANSDAVAAAIKAHAAPRGTRGVVLDAEAIAFIDVTALRMLEEVAADLARDDRLLVLAHDLGQVGDLLARSGADSPVRVYRTIDEAIAAVSGTARHRPTSPGPRVDP